MDGGSATVTLDSPAPGRVTLTGPATYVGTVEIDVDDRSQTYATAPLNLTPYQEALGATLIDRYDPGEDRARRASPCPGSTKRRSTPASTSSSCSSTPPAPTSSARLVQRRDAPDHTWYIGKGKAEELQADLCLAVDADTVVFDNELAPAQQFNLEKLLGRTAIDRTAVILDIFAQNAHTLEGKAQVELALLRYRLPRLRRGRDRQPVAAARRRRRPVRWRRDQARGRPPADHAPDHQARVRSRRSSPTRASLQRKSRRPQRPRQRRHRRLHQRRQVVAAQPAHRRRRARRGPPVRHARSRPRAASSLPGGEPVLLTDTVGFVRNLPHGLVEAFKGTLEVAALRRLPRARRRRQRARPARPDRRRARRCSTRSTPRRCPSCWCSTSPTSPRRGQAAGVRPPRLGRRQRRHGRGHRPLPAHARRSAAGADDGRRARRSRTSVATCSPRCTARARSCRPPRADGRRSSSRRACRRRRSGAWPSS